MVPRCQRFAKLVFRSEYPAQLAIDGDAKPMTQRRETEPSAVTPSPARASDARRPTDDSGSQTVYGAHQFRRLVVDVGHQATPSDPGGCLYQLRPDMRARRAQVLVHDARRDLDLKGIGARFGGQSIDLSGSNQACPYVVVEQHSHALSRLAARGATTLIEPAG